jgi:hypothetical protein
MEFPTDIRLQATLLAAFDEAGWHPVSGPAGYATLGTNGIYITVQPKPRANIGERGPDLHPDTLQRIADKVGVALNDAGWPCNRHEMCKMNLPYRYTFYAYRVR